MANSSSAEREAVHAVRIRVGSVVLEGDLVIPESPEGVVLFAHGGGDRRTAQNERFASHLVDAAHAATLLVDLLGRDETRIGGPPSEPRFDIGLLAERLVGVHDWLGHDTRTADLPVGYFAASTAAAAALLAASRRRDVVAIVSRGGRPDLVGKGALGRVESPTLFIVGEHDGAVRDLNLDAQRQLRCESGLGVVPGASHLFEEPGALDEVARLASDWFLAFLHPRHEARRRKDASARTSGVRRKAGIAEVLAEGAEQRRVTRR